MFDYFKEKVFYVFFSFRRYMYFSKLKLYFVCKIFNIMICLILIYNSEVWGVYIKFEFKVWDNNIFCVVLYL